MEFKGLFTAIITPFKGGVLDEDGLRANIDFQVENGVEGVVPVGTTGESATLSGEEHKKVVEITVDQVNGRAAVLAGTGSNNTMEALRYTEHARDVGADGALMITPYYNKPTQEGVYQHYKKIAEAVDIPIILYTVPGRTNVNIEPETTRRLSKIPNIVGIKDASGDLDQIMRVVGDCGSEFSVISGEDYLTYPIIALGGKGVISVTSNVAPEMMREFVSAALDGGWSKARDLHYRLYPLFKVLFIETNPSPAKAAMNMMGLASGEPRLPLVPVTRDSEVEIRRVLGELDLL
ncbi:MAG: 4-hydroxy-tetrahydrodipicolinate synthase [Candidatus Altiarchaeales archaeon]|nr:4-hydroxy-tetrahydrodipicolinate synthase [Candidatus Altiarchaeales archaeon]